MCGVKGDHTNRRLLVFFKYCASPTLRLKCGNLYGLITRLLPPAALLRSSPREEVGKAAYLWFLFQSFKDCKFDSNRGGNMKSFRVRPLILLMIDRKSVV